MTPPREPPVPAPTTKPPYLDAPPLAVAPVWVLTLLAVQLAFASQVVESKVAMAPRNAGGEGMDPWTVAMVRMLGATLFFQLLALFRSRDTAQAGHANWVHPHRVPPREHLKLFGLSLLGITINQMLFLLGLSRTSPTAVALLAVAIPIFSTALSVLFGKEVLTKYSGGGLLLATLGIVTLTGVQRLDVGAILVVINCLSYAAYVVFSKDAVGRLSASTVTTWIFTWGALTFAPLGLPALLRDAPHFTARGWLFLGYVVAIPTIFAYVANAWALGKAPASQVTAYIPLQPVLAAALGWVQLGTPLTPRLFAAGALILPGVWLASRSHPRTARAPASDAQPQESR